MKSNVVDFHKPLPRHDPVFWNWFVPIVTTVIWGTAFIAVYHDIVWGLPQ